MEDLPAFAWIKDLGGRLIYLNKMMRNLPEFHGDWFGKTDDAFWPSEIAYQYRVNDKKAIQSKRPVRTVEPYLANGDTRYVLVNKFPILGQRDKVVMVGGAAVDITDRKHAEPELETANRRLRTLSRRRVHLHESERQTLIRDLGRQFGQALALAKLNVESVMELYSKSSMVQTLIDTIAGLNSILQQVRPTSFDVRPLDPDEPELFFPDRSRGQLTSRQREILQLIAEGSNTKAIAGELGISVKTVEAHRLQLMQRLNIHEVAGLVRYAIRSGLVSLEV
jgi:DNA-binding CsgD family transcriptional regulator